VIEQLRTGTLQSRVNLIRYLSDLDGDPATIHLREIKLSQWARSRFQRFQRFQGACSRQVPGDDVRSCGKARYYDGNKLTEFTTRRGYRLAILDRARLARRRGAIASAVSRRLRSYASPFFARARVIAR